MTVYFDPVDSRMAWLQKLYNSIVRHKVLAAGLIALAGIVVLVVAINNRSDDTLLSEARNSDEAEEILAEVFTPGMSTSTEVEVYIQEHSLNCTDLEGADYDSNFADNLYDRSIVCWLPAPNTEARARLSWLDSLVVTYVFRTVFLFEGDELNEIRVILDDRAL